MLNPIITQRRHFIVYLLSFAIIFLFHFIILTFFFGYPMGVAFADAAVYTVLMFFLGIGTWYIVQHLTLSEQKYHLVLADHLVAGAVVVLLWLFGGYFVLSTIFQNKAGYIDFLNQTIPWRFVYGFLLYAVIVMVYYLISYYRDYHEKLMQENQLKQAIQESELNLLKSQINPHFLFNSLNSINALMITDTDKAREMIVELSEFLRYTVRGNENEQISLREELENIDRYLGIEKIRFGNRLVIEKELEEVCLDRKIPNMILQPLYENAIKHGLNESTDQVTVTTTCRAENEWLRISISNNFTPGSISKKGKGIGIANVQKRLMLHFHRTDLVNIEKTGNYFTIHLTIPVLT
ncbi:MAG: histidine kinase [Bacteroidales bacterium]|nr:histidine kinase [Bacteroidales bacterium]